MSGSCLALALCAACGGASDATGPGAAGTTHPVVTTRPTVIVQGTTRAVQTGKVIPTYGAMWTKRETRSPGEPTEPVAVLVDIRAAEHSDFDRVTFEFDRPFRGYTVSYVPRVANDPNGWLVPLPGRAFLEVNIKSATFDNSYQVTAAADRQQYKGPKRLALNLPEILEVAPAGDFESVVSFGFGLKMKNVYRVIALDSPSRLVIDIAHR